MKPPHPATVQRKQPPHAATIQRNEQPGKQPPHAAAVQRKQPPHAATVARFRPPHPAVAQPQLARPRDGGAVQRADVVPSLTLTILGEGTNGNEAEEELYNVGQRICVRVDVNDAVFQSAQWTLGGNPIAGYVADSILGSIIELDDDDLEAQIVTFYWTRPGQYQVSVAVTTADGGQLQTARACDVAGPVAHRADGHTPGGVDIRTIDETEYIVAGSPHGPHGIDFVFEFQNPNLTGSFNGIQVFTRYHLEIHPDHGQALIVDGANNRNYLDSDVPYGDSVDIEAGVGRWEASDSPAQGFDDDFAQIRFELDADMYLVYRPVGPNAIWVAIARVGWELRAYASKHGDVWQRDVGCRCEVVLESDDYQALPEWEAEASTLLDLDD
ncbi:hypothetical protein WMF28_00780 [Sorangium sp. So ce590]|uniref:hypothetical protein n=1 Tax=Sorangium sp. So ce590 TaxID=3133317 RepID=UPI003F5F0A3D